MNVATKTIATIAMYMGAAAAFSQNTVSPAVHSTVQLSSGASLDVQQDWLTLTLTLALTRVGRASPKLRGQDNSRLKPDV